MVFPSSIDLAGAEVEIADLPQRESRLRNVLEPLRSRFRYILIDCPPSLGFLTLNGLRAADEVLIPIQAEYFALEGLARLMKTVERIRGSVHPDLRIGGILLTMYDSRTNLSRQVSEDLRSPSAGADLPGRDSQERAPRRGAEPREACDHVRHLLAGRAGVSRAGGRVHRSLEGKDEKPDMTTMRKKGLGRGLDALLASHDAQEPAPAVLAPPQGARGKTPGFCCGFLPPASPPAFTSRALISTRRTWPNCLNP